MRNVRWDWILAVGVALATALVFAPNLNAPLMLNWDDGTFLWYNLRLRLTWANVWGYFRWPFQNLYTPLAMVSLMLDHALFGFAPWGYRVHNLLLHIGCLWLLAGIARRLGGARWAAWGAALLWAVHVQRVESVVWIAERKDVLCGFFALLSVWCVLRARRARRRGGWVCGASLAGALSILAKPMSMALPGVFVMLAIGLDGGKMWRRWRLWAIPALVILGMAILSWLITRRDNAGMLQAAWRVPLHNLGWYPLTALNPWPYVHPIHPPVRSLAAALGWLAGCVALAALALVLSRRLRGGVRAGLCLVLTAGGVMVPVLGMLNYTMFHYCDRYNYLVSMVMWVAVALLARVWLRGRRMFRVGKLVVVLLAGIEIAATAVYLPVWQNEYALAVFCVGQAGVPNAKSLELAMSVALTHDGHSEWKPSPSELLHATARRYETSHEILMQDGSPMSATDRGICIMICHGHAAYLQGQYAIAQSLLEPLGRRLETEPRVIFPLQFAGRYVCRDLAAMALMRGDLASARRWLRLESNYLNPAFDQERIRLNEELRRRIQE